MRVVIILMSMVAAAYITTAQTSAVVSGKTAFSIKYWAGTCDGTFDAPKGKMKFDPTDLSASEIDVTIPVASFNTGNSTRDKDMKEKKYFNASAFPQIRFTSTKITDKGGTYYADGALTIKGVTQRVSLPFKAVKKSDGSYAITSTFKLNRLDFKVGTETITMKDMVTLNISAIIK